MIRTIFAAARVAAPALVVAGALTSAMGLPAQAADLGKEESCNYQGQVMAAVQQARLDGVAQEGVAEAIAATQPSWPDNFSKAIPQLAAHVYQMKRRDLKSNDLGAIFEAQCVENWDQIQAMKNGMSGN